MPARYYVIDNIFAIFNFFLGYIFTIYIPTCFIQSADTFLFPRFILNLEVIDSTVSHCHFF